jgi:hypothetical protein
MSGGILGGWVLGVDVSRRFELMGFGGDIWGWILIIVSLGVWMLVMGGV